MSTEINIKKRITILEESAILTKDLNSIDFVGAGVNASSVGGDVTVTIPGSSGDTTYYLNQTIAQAPYKEFSSIVTSVVEQVVPLTVAGGVTSVIAEYQTPSGVPGTTQIPAGLWQFFLHFNAGSAGQNWIIRPTVLKRDLGGIETLLFTPDPVIVTSMNVTTEMYTSYGVFPATTLLTTDRIVVRISMQNTTGVSQTVNFRTEGSQHYSVGLTTLNQVIPTGAVTNVTGTAPVVSSGGTTPAISIPQADALTDGYLSSSDFAVFDAKVQSVTGLDTDNTDPENPIINISVDGTTITGSGTPIDPLVSVSTISGSGTTNYVSKWTSASALGDSLIQDDGTTVSINNVPQANISLSVLSTKEYGFASENTKTTSNTYGIYGSATGVGKARGVGVYGESTGGTLSNIGTEGAGVGGTVAIGGKFTSSTATTNYSVQLQDGTEGVGKVLTSMTVDGKAQWQTPASGTVTSVTGTSPVVSSGGATPAISIPAATTLVNGYLTSIDWTTFDAKVGGSGTTNYLSKFTGTGTVGNSNIFDNGTNVGIGTITPTKLLDVNGDILVNGLTVGKGGTSVLSNTVVGITAGLANTTGSQNAFFGYEAGLSNTTGLFNTSIGSSSGYHNIIGSGNVSVGFSSGKFFSALNNILSNANNSIFIGNQSNALLNNGTNEIVIGALTLGKGSNTVLLGNTSITDTYLQGILHINNTYTIPISNGSVGNVLTTSGLGTTVFQALPFEIQAAASDEVTNLTVGTSKVTFRLPRAMTLTGVRASLSTEQTAGAVLTVDINLNGVSVLGTKLTFDNTEKTTVTAAIPATIVTSALTDDGEITVDIDTIGTAGARGLKITLIGTRA